MDCLFCKIISGEIPCKKIYEDDVKRINSSFFNDTREGIAFCNKANVSLEDYPQINKAYDDYNAFLVDQNRKL